MVENIEIDYLSSDYEGDSDDDALDDSLDDNIPENGSRYITEDKLNDFFRFHSSSAFNFLHVNCRSLKQNFGSFKHLFSVVSRPLSAIAVTETWLTEHLQEVYGVLGYMFFSNPRIGKLGGGVG